LDRSIAEVLAPTSGSVVALLVAVGDRVTAGQEIAVIESMKMEIPVEAEVGGTVLEFAVEEGTPIDVDEVVARIRV
jgi:acetyl-CoA carboxylase biotin carboxyl carrier protein